VTAQEVTAWEIMYAVLHARFFWPLYALLYLCVGMSLKMRWVEYRTRDNLGGWSARSEGVDWVVRQKSHPARPACSAQQLGESGGEIHG
jgi:hypothetical protein